MTKHAHGTADEDSSRPQFTSDGRYVVVNGRRWRATDPGLAEDARVDLVAELMAARRAVQAGKVRGDALAIAMARSRVHDAKVALGERGSPWWEAPSPQAAAQRVAATQRALSRLRSRDDIE